MPDKPLVIKYRTIIQTRHEQLAVDVASTLGPDAAGRRAHWTIVASRRFGDIDDITVLETYTVCTWFAACDNLAEQTMPHPVLGEVPICDRCRAIVTK